jgi:hypothetical protein
VRGDLGIQGYGFWGKVGEEPVGGGGDLRFLQY